MRSSGERREVHRQHVGVQQRERAVRPRGFGERLEQVTVEFDRGQRAVAVEHRQRERALARTDLDDAVPGTRVHRQQDLLDDTALVQEVLPERLLRLAAEAGGVAVLGAAVAARRAHARPRARAAARRVHCAMAACRLEGSASPVPAMSSAVPWSTATRG
jgi:hypothetical protein